MYRQRRRLSDTSTSSEPGFELSVNNTKFGGEIENLTFSGGGGKGWIYLEVLKELEILWAWSGFSLGNIKRVAGASCGAICALVVALNFDANLRDKLIYKNPGSKLLDFKWSNFLKYIKRCYLCDGVALRSWLITLIKEKTGLDDPSFKELDDWSRRDQQRGGQGIKELHVKVTCLTSYNEGQDTCSLQKTPQVPISLAILASCSIPGIFPRVEFGGNAYHDALFSGNNNPVKIFDKKGQINKKTLGLSLTDAESAKKLLFGHIIHISGIKHLLLVLINSIIHYETYKSNAEEKDRLVLITTPKSIGALTFGWSKRQWNLAKIAAKKSVRYFFQRRTPEELRKYNEAVFKENEKKRHEMNRRKNARKIINRLKGFISKCWEFIKCKILQYPQKLEKSTESIVGVERVVSRGPKAVLLSKKARTNQHLSVYRGVENSLSRFKKFVTSNFVPVRKNVRRSP